MPYGGSIHSPRRSEGRRSGTATNWNYFEFQSTPPCAPQKVDPAVRGLLFCGSQPSDQTIVKPTPFGPVANTDAKPLIYGLLQKGRVLAQDGGMRGVHENKPDHPDNHGYIVSHVGLSNDDHWEDFRELDFDDQRLIHEWIAEEANDDDGGIGEGRPRRFDQDMLVDDEIIGEFISRSFLDPEDDRVLDEFLNREIGGGIKLADLMSRDELSGSPARTPESRTGAVCSRARPTAAAPRAGTQATQ